MTHLQVKCSGTSSPHVCIHMAKNRLSAPSLPIPNSWGHICLKYHLKLRCKGNILVSGPKFLPPVALTHASTQAWSTTCERLKNTITNTDWAREWRNKIKTTTCLVLGPHYMFGRTSRTESELYFLSDNSKQLAFLFPNSTAASPVKRILN